MRPYSSYNGSQTFVLLSGFPNHCNGAEGIHNFRNLCKYGHIRQAKGGTRASPGTHPTLETNKQHQLDPINRDYFKGLS